MKHTKYQEYKESYFGSARNLGNDFRIILAIAIIRTDTAIHYSTPISTERVTLMPPIWKRKLKASEQKISTKKKKRIPKKVTKESV